MRREQGEEGHAETFADALADLKRHGSMLLVVGSGDRASLAAACRRLRGDAADDRRHLYVRPDESALGPDAGPGDRVVAYSTAARSASATADPSDGRTALVEGGLAALETEIAAAIDTLRPEAGFEPSELRVCIGAADALLSAHDQERVFQFFHALGGRMHESRGMCHVHLPVAYDDEHVGTLSPLFDAVIEVRRGEEQRWHLQDPRLTTDWLPL